MCVGWGGKGQIEIFFPCDSFSTVYISLNTKFHVPRPAGSDLKVPGGSRRRIYGVAQEDIWCHIPILFITLHSI